jgi:hypothetical protein
MILDLTDMSLEEFHTNFRSDLNLTIAERIESGEGPFPSEELVFAEKVMQHMTDAGLCEEPVICHWNGKVGNAKLRITGYALSSDQTALDLFITNYFGSEQIQDLSDADAAATAAEGVRFLFRAASGSLDTKIDPTHTVRDLVSTIRVRWMDIDRLRVFVITDGKIKSKRFRNNEVKGKIVALEAMDIERLYRHTDGKPRDELAISFSETIGYPLPCVHVPDSEADYEYALAAIPGQIIRNLYMRFGTRLLEANVRTFLGASRKKSVNYGVVQTLKNEPGHFLAFNNGLVIVCDEAGIDRLEDGRIGLSYLKGLQIVNGGQTTSSIYFASRDDKTIDLSHVMVPAKIIILKESEDDSRDRLISNVSRYANSQNAVKLSDLSSNRPFHVQLEKLANDTWCPDGATRWFYERAAGAYNVMLLREGNTPAKRRKIQDAISTKRKLTKNDIAKYHEAWREKPDVVARGGEKNFVEFMNVLDNDAAIVPNPLDPQWYRAMIAKVILFKAIESMIKSGSAKDLFRQGWVNIATYVVSVVANRLGDKLDLEQIWARQGITQQLRDLLWDWAVIVNAEFNSIAPGQQFSEVAKRPDTWAHVKSCNFPLNIDAISEVKKS